MEIPEDKNTEGDMKGNMGENIGEGIEGNTKENTGEVKKEADLVKPLVADDTESKVRNKLILGVSVILILGVVSGWGLFRLTSYRATEGGEMAGMSGAEGSAKIKINEIYGSKNDVFKDSAIGVLEINDEDGEGTHKLLREGGESQTAYLTSSMVDLDMFVGREVEIWGETFSSGKVGWLMDVGRVKVLK